MARLLIASGLAVISELGYWIIKNQFGRRNLQLFQRAELALKMKGVIAAKAREKMESGENQHSPLQNSVKGSPIHTESELAKIAGVSRDTIHSEITGKHIETVFQVKYVANPRNHNRFHRNF